MFCFLMPTLFSYTVAISPMPLNGIPADGFELTCTAAKVGGGYCNIENEI